MGVPPVCDKFLAQGLGNEPHQDVEYPGIVPDSMRHRTELHHLENHFHPGVVVRVLEAAVGLAESKLPDQVERRILRQCTGSAEYFLGQGAEK